ncbi:MAG: copper transporter [Coriobacteriia bacterium]
MYNIKYHIASLVAVFLALALGLVLGGLVVRQGGFDKQQNAIVASLQKDFSTLKKQNTALKSDLELEKGYSSQMTSAWIAGRLNGRSVLVITSNVKGTGADAAVAAIKDAGGNPVVVIMSKPQFGLADKTIAAAAQSVVGSSTDLKTGVATTLASEWSQPDVARPLTEALQKAGVITLTGLSASMAATQVINVAAFSKKPDPLALDVTQAYAAAGRYALGAQSVGIDTGVAAAAAARKLSAFDTLDTNVGRFTLVALLTGGQQGYYSLDANATAKFPPVPAP